MKLMCLAACALAALAFAPAAGAEGQPQDEPKAEGGKGAPRQAEESQQDRMRRCAHEAKEKELKGDERRSFMSACLRH